MPTGLGLRSKTSLKHADSQVEHSWQYCCFTPMRYPALHGAACIGEAPSMCIFWLLSQVLSFTSSKVIVGTFADSLATRIVTWSIAAIFMAINIGALLQVSCMYVSSVILGLRTRKYLQRMNAVNSVNAGNLMSFCVLSQGRALVTEHQISQGGSPTAQVVAVL